MTEGATTEPAVTVIVAAYNCAGYIAECLQSLKDQDSGDFEAIVVDDASTDGTAEVARGFLSDGRFTLIESERNGGPGPGRARNKALDAARGEYVLYVDADDFLRKDALGKLIERARAQDLDELVYSAQTFHESNAAMKVLNEDFSGREDFEGVGTGPEMLAFHSDRGQYYAPGQLRMIRRAMIEREGIRFPEGIIHEDELYSFFTAAASKRSSFLNEPLYLRRQRTGSIMSSRRHTAESVIGMLTSICVLRRWVAAHAASLDDGFLRATGRIVAQWSAKVAGDWDGSLTDGERARIADGLFADGREELFFHILGSGDVAVQAADEYRGSLTYRVGDLVVRAPRAVRDHVKAAVRRSQVRS